MRHVLVVVFLGSGMVTAQENGGEAEASFDRGAVTVDERTMPYRLLAPAEPAEGKRYPLFLFLHGRGERGDDNVRQLAYFPRVMAEKARRASTPCFVLAPQCPSDTTWNDVDRSQMRARGLGAGPAWPQRAVIAALEHVVRTQPVDTERIYLTGLSMGGFGAWELATRHPDWFAACVPVCGGGEPAQARRLVGLPIRAWHGADDDIVPAAASRAMVEAVRKAGGHADHDELEGVGHDSWLIAYGVGGAVEWMLEHRRDAARSSAGLEMIRRTATIRPGERIAFLGDSITEAGAGPGGYVNLIEKALAKRHDLEDVAVIGAGISGNRVPDLEKRLEADVLEKGATVVFVYIGINDVWRSTGCGTPAEDYEAGLGRLVDRIERAGATVVLATPTVIGERAGGKNPFDSMLDDYVALTRRVATAKGVFLVDLRAEITDYLAVLNSKDRSSGVLTGDGVHLNAAGNRFLADRAARGIVEALERRAGAK